jgi:hypothetical protein
VSSVRCSGVTVNEKHGGPKFPVVCVGGSAGGLDAYTHLLRHLPADMGVAIVIESEFSRLQVRSGVRVKSRAVPDIYEFRRLREEGISWRKIVAELGLPVTTLVKACRGTSE